jgi:GntR family transcriptional regulator
MADASLDFEIHPSSGTPIYRQIMDQVRALVASRRLAPGQMVPSIRQLATDLEINMMTVSKAYARLEADGVLERQRGTGMRVLDSAPSGSVGERQEALKPLVDAMVMRAVQLNLTEPQILAVLHTVFKERRSRLKQSSTPPIGSNIRG